MTSHKSYGEQLGPPDFRISYTWTALPGTEFSHRRFQHMRSDFAYEDDLSQNYMIWPEFESSRGVPLGPNELVPESGLASMWVINVKHYREYHLSRVQIGTRGYLRVGARILARVEVVEVVRSINGREEPDSPWKIVVASPTSRARPRALVYPREDLEKKHEVIGSVSDINQYLQELNTSKRAITYLLGNIPESIRPGIEEHGMWRFLVSRLQRMLLCVALRSPEQEAKYQSFCDRIHSNYDSLTLKNAPDILQLHEISQLVDSEINRYSVQ